MPGDMAAMMAMQGLLQQALLPAIEAKTHVEQLKRELAQAHQDRKRLAFLVDELRLKIVKIETLLESLDRNQQKMFLQVGDQYAGNNSQSGVSKHNRVEFGGVDGAAAVHVGDHADGNMTRTEGNSDMSGDGKDGNNFDFGGVGGDVDVNTGDTAGGDMTKVDNVEGDFNQANAKDGGVSAVGDGNTIDVSNTFQGATPPQTPEEFFEAVKAAMPPSAGYEDDPFGPLDSEDDYPLTEPQLRGLRENFGEVVAESRVLVRAKLGPPSREDIAKREEEYSSPQEMLDFLKDESGKPEEEQSKGMIAACIGGLRKAAPIVGKCALAFGRGALLKVIGNSWVTAGVVCAMDALTDHIGVEQPDSAKTGDPTGGGGGWSDNAWDDDTGWYTHADTGESAM